MDTLIERKPGINRKRLYWVGGVMLGLAVIAYFIFRDTASSMAVEKDRLTIATVEQAEFSDYIRVIGQVMPSRIIYMDAIEGGRVEERRKEEASCGLIRLKRRSEMVRAGAGEKGRAYGSPAGIKEGKGRNSYVPHHDAGSSVKHFYIEEDGPCLHAEIFLLHCVSPFSLRYGCFLKM